VTDAPKATVGGGSRGEKDGEPVICVLAPDRLALTTQEQPELFWYISQPTRRPIRLTLVDEDRKSKPTILRQELPGSAVSGVHRLTLADHDVHLRAGAEYRFSVELVIDRENQSENVVGQTLLKRIEPSAELVASIRKASSDEHASIYAADGIWYDALAAISKQVDEDPAMLADRASLLEQVGLKDVAAADREATKPPTSRASQEK
jgi:hypothetical protein